MEKYIFKSENSHQTTNSLYWTPCPRVRDITIASPFKRFVWACDDPRCQTTCDACILTCCKFHKTTTLMAKPSNNHTFEFEFLDNYNLKAKIITKLQIVILLPLLTNRSQLLASLSFIVLLRRRNKPATGAVLTTLCGPLDPACTWSITTNGAPYPLQKAEAILFFLFALTSTSDPREKKARVIKPRRDFSGVAKRRF